MKARRCAILPTRRRLKSTRGQTRAAPCTWWQASSAFAHPTARAFYPYTNCDHRSKLDIDFGLRMFYICSILAQRGRRPEAFLKVERGWRSRGGARNVAPGGAETAIRALRPVCEELAARCPEEMPGHGSADPHQKIARQSAERRASLIAKGRGAPRTRPGTCSQHVPGGLANPRASRRSAAPHGGSGKREQTPGARARRGNEG